MEIKYKATGLTEHVSQEVGNFAVKSGLADEVIKPIAKPEPHMVWAACEGPIQGDYQHAPIVRFHCASCGIQGAGNPSPERLKQQIIIHCGVRDVLPPNIAEKYLELRSAYLTRSKRRRITPPVEGAPSDQGARLRDEYMKKQGRI